LNAEVRTYHVVLVAAITGVQPSLDTNPDIIPGIQTGALVDSRVPRIGDVIAPVARLHVVEHGTGADRASLRGHGHYDTGRAGCRRRCRGTCRAGRRTRARVARQ
jgi:hypothetical protein